MPKSQRVYADTAHNRSLGRVGKPYGTAVDVGPGPSPAGFRDGDTRREEGELLSVEEVNRRLQALGVSKNKLKEEGWGVKVSKCVRAAIQRGFIELKGEDKQELKQVICKIKFEDGCGHSKDVKLSDVLYQPDYGGNDYEVGLPNATVICKKAECKDDEGCRTFVTDICNGDPAPNCGKFHNHCDECPGFGMCIGDYREQHCKKCQGHYHGTFGMFPCYHCNGEEDSD